MYLNCTCARTCSLLRLILCCFMQKSPGPCVQRIFAKNLVYLRIYVRFLKLLSNRRQRGELYGPVRKDGVVESPRIGFPYINPRTMKYPFCILRIIGSVATHTRTTWRIQSSSHPCPLEFSQSGISVTCEHAHPNTPWGQYRGAEWTLLPFSEPRAIYSNCSEFVPPGKSKTVLFPPASVGYPSCS